MLGEASYTVKVSKELPADELLRDDAAKQIENRACGSSS